MRLLPQQKALGERWAMIREEWLRGENGHGALGSLFSQGLGGGRTGQPTADEQEIDLGRHGPRLMRGPSAIDCNAGPGDRGRLLTA